MFDVSVNVSQLFLGHNFEARAPRSPTYAAPLCGPQPMIRAPLESGGSSLPGLLTPGIAACGWTHGRDFPASLSATTSIGERMLTLPV